MKARRFYLIFCVLGILLPYSQFVPWLLEHGLNPSLFFRQLFATRISASFAMDVMVSAIVLIWFIQSEGKRCGAASLVADDWNINCRCVAWIAAISFSKTGDVGSKNRLQHQ